MTDPAPEIDPGTAFLIEAFDPANRSDPYPLYGRMRAEHRVLAAGPNMWFVFDHEIAHGVLRSRVTSSDERRSTSFKNRAEHDERFQKYAEEEPFMLFRDPPDHTRLRSLVSRAFTPRTVDRLRPRLEELATGLLDRLADGGPVDLVSTVAYPYPVTLIAELLGIPEADAPVFQAMSDDLSMLIESSELRSPDEEKAIDRARVELSAYIGELLIERRRRPGDDLISGLLAARDGEDRLSESELINMVILLLLAGHETTANQIGNAVVALLRNPGQLEAWRRNPGLGSHAVDEIVRYDSSVQMAMRVMLEPTELGGAQVEAFDHVVCLLGAANHDPAVFVDPGRFDLARPNASSNLSFGGGIHHCLGMALARTEMVVLLGQLVRRFPTIGLVEEPQIRSRFVLRGYDQVMVEVSV